MESMNIERGKTKNLKHRETEGTEKAESRKQRAESRGQKAEGRGQRAGRRERLKTSVPSGASVF
jgi:hypothetical protein